MVFFNRLKIVIQQSMPATSNISNMGYLKISITVILTILLTVILKMMRFLLANHSNIFIIKICFYFFHKQMVQLHHSVYLPLLSISFYMGNSLTKVALAGHLKILNIATHHSIKKLASPFTLMSKYDSQKTSFKIQYVCREKQCKQLLVCGGDGHPTLLQNCGHKHIRNNSHCCFILQLPIEQQLLYFMKHHGLPEVLQQVDPNIRSDVNSGTMYRKLVESGVINSFTITLQLNADGASCYRKSKYSFWPLMALINDVPYKLRRSYIILLALWFGNKKPQGMLFWESLSRS